MVRFFILGLTLSAYLFQSSAFAEPVKFPSVDALAFWNRSIEVKDAILRTEKKLADALGMYKTQIELFGMMERLRQKGAITEEQFRESLWKKEDAEIVIREVKQTMVEQDLYKQITALQYQWEMGEKPEAVAELVGLYSEQWRNRIDQARIALERDESELRLRDYQMSIADKLTPTGAMSREQYIHIRDRQGEVLTRKALDTQRIALAQTAYDDAKGRETSVRALFRGPKP